MTIQKKRLHWSESNQLVRPSSQHIETHHDTDNSFNVQPEL
jgi:hypothetical protein